MATLSYVREIYCGRGVNLYRFCDYLDGTACAADAIGPVAFNEDATAL